MKEDLQEFLEWVLENATQEDLDYDNTGVLVDRYLDYLEN